MAFTINRSLTARNLGTVPKAPRVIYGIVLHDTAGSGTHNDTKYLTSPGDNRAVSVDFTVERDGNIYQLNPDLSKHFCYHAGRSTKFRGFENAAVNARTIGIEIVQKANLSLSPLYPDVQVQAVAWLCFKLCEQFHLAQDYITTHHKIITDGSRSDPRQFNWDLFWKTFNSYKTGVEVRPLPTGDDPEDDDIKYVIHTVKAGDTLWALSNLYTTTIESIKSLNGLNAASNTLSINQILKIKRGGE